MRALDGIALILVVIGAINWGLIGFFNNFNLIDTLFVAGSTLSKIIYGLVGIAGLYTLSFFGRDRDRDRREVK